MLPNGPTISERMKNPYNHKQYASIDVIIHAMWRFFAISCLLPLV